MHAIARLSAAIVLSGALLFVARGSPRRRCRCPEQDYTMGKHTHLINRLFTSKEDRALAETFAEKFGGMPGMDDRIPAMLQEAAATSDKIAEGSLSPVSS